MRAGDNAHGKWSFYPKNELLPLYSKFYGNSSVLWPAENSSQEHKHTFLLCNNLRQIQENRDQTATKFPSFLLHLLLIIIMSWTLSDLWGKIIWAVWAPTLEAEGWLRLVKSPSCTSLILSFTSPITNKNVSENTSLCTAFSLHNTTEISSELRG